MLDTVNNVQSLHELGTALVGLKIFPALSQTVTLATYSYFLHMRIKRLQVETLKNKAMSSLVISLCIAIA